MEKRGGWRSATEFACAATIPAGGSRVICLLFRIAGTALVADQRTPGPTFGR
jgi:hypothetical protein